MNRYLLALATVILLALPPSPVWADKSEMTLEDWTSGDPIWSMSLSPDGKRVAGLGFRNGRLAYVMDLDESKLEVIARHPGKLAEASFHQPWPDAVHWIDNDLLAVEYTDWHAFSVDLSGEEIARLGRAFIKVVPSADKGGDRVLSWVNFENLEIASIDPRTGARTDHSADLPGRLVNGKFDEKGVLRLATMVDTGFWSEKTTVTHWYRADGDAAWQKLAEFPVTNVTWRPVRLLREPNMLMVASREGRDTIAFFRYDVVQRRMLDMMAGHPTEDIQDTYTLADEQVELAATNGLIPQIWWFDQRWAQLQASVDAALPNRVNRLSGDKDGRVLISSYADVEPGVWYLLDTQKLSMREIGRMRPRIDRTVMRPMQAIHYKARDGLQIPAYLTRPAGDGPKPMVVLIHGGPQSRDHWGWDAEVQLLASRGYVVLQPQFRGSKGFGRKFEEAGYRQWGRAMQDDITDGVLAMVGQKIADPSRVCIYGGSYGGYAAMWGAIKTPELYRCSVSLAGVSDLAEAAEHSVIDDSSVVGHQFDLLQLGDPDKDKSMLDEVSPLRHADRVGVPMLIAYGLADRRVLPTQSSSMVSALKALGKPVESLEFPDEGHGLYWPRNQRTFYRALLDFLDRHIGADAPAVAPAAAAAASVPR